MNRCPMVRVFLHVTRNKNSARDLLCFTSEMNVIPEQNDLPRRITLTQQIFLSWLTNLAAGVLRALWDLCWGGSSSCSSALLLCCLLPLFTGCLVGVEPIFFTLLCLDLLLLFLQCTLDPKALMHDKSYSSANGFEDLFIVQNKALAFIRNKSASILAISLQLPVLS